MKNENAEKRILLNKVCELYTALNSQPVKRLTKMSSNNSIIGFVPVAIYDYAGNIAEVLYRPVFNTLPAPTTESIAPAEAHQTNEEWEAGEAFAEEVAGLETGMTKEEQDAGEEFAADMEAREWADFEDDRVDEEQAHIGKLQDADLKKEELHRLFRELIELNDVQKPLYKAVKDMEAEENPKIREKNKTKYWDTWNRMVAAQKDWLGTYEALKALDVEIKSLDPEHSFNSMIKARYPEEPDRDYEALNSLISRNFKSNISRDEKRRQRMHAPVSGKPAPPVMTLADKLSDMLAKQAAGRNPWE